jgi:hypothetical protein
MLEQQFARFLLDRINEKVQGIPEPIAKEIRLHLTELRGIVDTALEATPTRGRKGGSTNA